MGNRIICIGREFGSGGHEVAVRLSERLGIKACAGRSWGAALSNDLWIGCGKMSCEAAVSLLASRFRELGE